MQKLLVFLLLMISFVQFGAGQKQTSLELTSYSRYEKHADYTSRYGDRSYTNSMQLWGMSNGLSMSYLFPVNKWFKLKAGVGYHQLGIDKVRSSSPWSADIPSRTIDYTHPAGIQPLFNTDQYHYNNFAGSAGFSYEHTLNDKLALNFGADYSYYYTFSQRYRITYNNTALKTKNVSPLGFGSSAYVGLIQKVQQSQYYINPGVLIPIYQQLSGDSVFRENDISMHKWFKGIGLFISLGKYF